jgi:glycine oxidase
MFDCLIIGGGVIGLSLAYELAAKSRRVCVIDRDRPGRAASWAGAGMLPPASPVSTDPVEQLGQLSNELHPIWAKQLLEETGIDTGYRQSGAIYLARSETAAADLRARAERSNRLGITFDALSATDITSLEPSLEAAQVLAAFHVPGESQLRNPHHLQALEAACLRRGVQIVPNATAMNFEVRGEWIESLQTSAGAFCAEQFCITTGAWTANIAAKIGVTLSIKPIRGQIALLRTPQQILKRIINEGPRYLVPRDDGRVLVGSTMEDVGFDTSTTPEAIEGLVQFARSLSPALSDAELEVAWSGLRPASVDGNPYLGRPAGLKNCVIAAGHTRSGLHLSTGTAVVMARLLNGEDPGLELTPFRLDRQALSAQQSDHGS